MINADDADLVEAILPALAGSGKVLLQTSGSSIVGDNAGGEPSHRIYDEDTRSRRFPTRPGGSRSTSGCAPPPGTGCAASCSARA